MTRFLLEWSVHFPTALYEDKRAVWESHGFDGGPIGYLVLDAQALSGVLVDLGLAPEPPEPGGWRFDRGLFKARIQPVPSDLYHVTVVDGFVRVATREDLLDHIHAASGRYAGSSPDVEAALLAQGYEDGCDFTWQIVQPGELCAPSFPSL